MDLKPLSDVAFTAASGFGVAVAVCYSTINGWKKKPEEPISLPAKESKDAVVLNAAIADSQQIANLAVAIKELVAWLKDREEDADRHNNRIVQHLTDIAEAVERQTRVFRDRTIL